MFDNDTFKDGFFILVITRIDFNFGARLKIVAVADREFSVGHVSVKQDNTRGGDFVDFLGDGDRDNAKGID